ncbi:hypothetical protein PAT3040_06693 [Paenibacillus agaridevorans]|uniref:Uncharacterized protein n=1 Tax=Paenibacillus agaridevorans TaxID=171404 RepID=A0A2R5F646_9BACL|nr:hypothetical protein PAT3040_06693 [Paenibacillus agaridevorans]
MLLVRGFGREERGLERGERGGWKGGERQKSIRGMPNLPGYEKRGSKASIGAKKIETKGLRLT